MGSELLVSSICRQFLIYLIAGPVTTRGGPAAIMTGTAYVLWTVRTVSPMREPAETKPVKVGMPVGPDVKPVFEDMRKERESFSAG